MGKKFYWFCNSSGPELEILGGPYPFRQGAVEEATAYIRETRALAFPEHIQVIYQEDGGETVVDDWTWATRDRS